MEFDREAISKICGKYIQFYQYFETKQQTSDCFHNIKEMVTYLTDDFYGYLQGKTSTIKKIKTLEVYRYFYRFSMEKLMKFSNSPIFQLMLLHYLKESKMQRVHQKSVFKKSVRNYYKAMENIIN